MSEGHGYLSREEIKEVQLKKLNDLLLFVNQNNEFYCAKYQGLKFPLNSLAELENLPFTTKQEFVRDQNENPPIGKNHCYPEENYIRYHQTSGTTGRPLKVLDTAKSWEWWADCWVEVFRAVGVTKHDRVFLAFSFGPFIGFWSAYEGAKKIGALVIPGGGQTTLERLQSIINNHVTVLVCTPSYALHMDEVAKEAGIDLSHTSIKITIHAGEPGASVPAVRDKIEQIWGAKCYDHSGMTEMGVVSYSCDAKAGLHCNESEFIVEVIDSDTLRPVANGEKGELVLTNLGRLCYPAIRYRTHDLVIKDEQICSCGNPNILLTGGIIGRTDDMTIIRGINIFPPSIEVILREFRELVEFRIVFYTVGGMDQVKVEVELSDYSEQNIAQNEQTLNAMRKLLRERLGLRIDIELKDSHTLPRFEMKARRTVDQRSKATESQVKSNAVAG
jgi:phenylacetate-CoA ligase